MKVIDLRVLQILEAVEERQLQASRQWPCGPTSASDCWMTALLLGQPI